MSEYQWTQYYEELATKLLNYKNNRVALINIIKDCYDSIGIKLPTLESDNNIVDIDPFTVFGLFNKGITESNRISIISALGKAIDVTAKLPDNFDGIPILNNLAATFYYFKDDRGEFDIDNLWDVFEAAINLAEEDTEEKRALFSNCYDIVLNQKGIKWNLSMGLFWIRPYYYLNLDSRNRWFITEPGNQPDSVVKLVKRLKDNPSDAKGYLEIVDECKKALASNAYDYKTFPELSHTAWLESERVNQENRQKKDSTKSVALADEDVDTVHYWLYSPGEGAFLWDECYSEGIMEIGWGEIGDLSIFESKDDMKTRMKEVFDPSLSYKNAAHATWQFANEMKVGDVVFVKKGMHQLLGKGVVTSDYYYDDFRSDGYNNCRNVDWTHNGTWAHPGQAVMKTLTDISSYNDYVKLLLGLFDDEKDEDIEEVEKSYPEYTPERFLSDVYMTKDSYLSLVELLRSKKNIILQGAPGVGKTYAAKRLAYSMMGRKDIERVMMVQFHQSYSYEDFIMGFRPTSDGFELKKGAFYNFCKSAEIDSDNEYFFIIDEINRGNLSKIFGELFMLIENDKRGIQMQLLYSDEKFSVPANVHIVGMMNTADRSLAMIDYALRRRFAFYEMKPGFQTEGFINYRKGLDNQKFDKLIDCVERLNDAISADDSLGEGFCIGHSFFCNLDTTLVSENKLSSIIEYEIIPLLKEYWFDEPIKVKEWSNNLRSAIK